ncbi:MAG: DNA primase TraC [Bacteroides sp.]
MTDKKPFYEVVADRLISQLEAGTAPFQVPWEPGQSIVPHNPVSGTKYKGANAFWLTMQGRSDPRWMTYKQAQSVDAQVMKGEKGTLIQYWKFSETKPVLDAAGNPILGADKKPLTKNVQLERPRVFSAVVFNAEQIEGLPELEQKTSSDTEVFQRHERAENILANVGVPIYHDQSDSAFYRPSTDSIHLPQREQFISPDRYYAVALHEVGHSTGHHSRLDRDLTGAFRSESYAREELRAEIASLMIGDELGIGHDPGQHAAYVGSWIKVLREDPKEILRAAKDAEAIKDYVMEREKTISITQDQDTPQPGDAVEAQEQLNPSSQAEVSGSDDKSRVAATNAPQGNASTNTAQQEAIAKIAEKFSADMDEQTRQEFLSRVAARLDTENSPEIKIKTIEPAQQELDFER